jgi:Ras-related GTP-binding protein C/D
VNRNIGFDVLINKVDGDSYLSSDHKVDCQNEIQQQIADELAEIRLPIEPHFHLTSIYDHSVRM